MSKKEGLMELVDNKVKYSYIPKRIKGISEPNHVLYDGKLAGAIDTFTVLKAPSGHYVIPMTETEREFIKKGLHLTEEDLSLTGNSTYLRNLSVEVPKEGLELDLSKPYDLLVDKVLLAYTNRIAPNKKSQKHKQSYIYVRTMASEDIDDVLHSSDVRKKAYKLLGVLEESRERMIMYLFNEGSRVHSSIPDKEVRRLVNVSMESSYEKFMNTLEDPLFTEKGIINMAVSLGVVEERSRLYFYESKPLAAKDEVSTLPNAAVFLKDKANSAVKLAISKQTLDAFKGD